jgi:hypothetical protein
MKAAIGNKHQAIIKIVKKLDQNLMTRNVSTEDDLSQLAVTEATNTITLDNCIDLLCFADHHIVDELKINCLKFIMLNLVSFFSDGTKLNDQLLRLPVYLIRDIENFLKLKNVDKFLWLDMRYFELEHDYEPLLEHTEAKQDI